MKTHKNSFLCIAIAMLVLGVSSCGGDEEKIAAGKAVSPAPSPGAASTAASATAAVPAGVDVAALLTQAKGIFGSLPDRVASKDNKSNISKVVLGRFLFQDTRLSKDGKFSCATCHDLGHYGVDGKATTEGPSGHAGRRNVPTVINAAAQAYMYWDGRAKTVEEQAGLALLNPDEMGMADEASVMAVIESVAGYKRMFKPAFRGESEPVTFGNVAKAIGAFERSLLTPTRFDSFVKGKKNALHGNELTGLKLFLEAGCIACHIAPTIGGQVIQKLGLVKPYPSEDKGVGGRTGNEEENFFFKVPQLRNVTETGPYMHDGSIESLAKMVRIMGDIQIDRQFDDEEVAALVAFLGTLTGKVNPKLATAPKPLK